MENVGSVPNLLRCVYAVVRLAMSVAVLVAALLVVVVVVALVVVAVAVVVVAPVLVVLVGPAVVVVVVEVVVVVVLVVEHNRVLLPVQEEVSVGHYHEVDASPSVGHRTAGTNKKTPLGYITVKLADRPESDQRRNRSIGELRTLVSKARV